MLFTARQLLEKWQDQNVDLFTAFVDLTKAFDTVSRDGFWKIMQRLAVQPDLEQLCGNSMMACLHGSRTIESNLNGFL